jgi:D-threo-aldose 1-dehydrogenase
VSAYEPGRLGYGAANVGNLHRAMSDEDAAATLEAAWQSGIRYFDTAPHYGLGLSERRLGSFLQTKPRDEFVLSTKVGRLLRPHPQGEGTLDLANDFVVPGDQTRVWDFGAEGVRASLDESLERLGLDRVDVLYLHDPERYDLELGLEVAVPAMAALRDAGVVRAVGVGSMDVAALLASARTGLLDLLMVAGRYTLAEQPALAEVVPACAQNGVGIVNASVFNTGLLATDDPGGDARYEYGGVPGELLEHVRAIAAVCHELGVELPAAALQYPLLDPVVVSVVVGGSSAGQLRQNAGRSAVPIPDELWRRLAESGLAPDPRSREI